MECHVLTASTGLDHALVVIKTCRSSSKRRIPFQTPLQSKFILLECFILGAMNNIFHDNQFLLTEGMNM